MRRSIVLTAVAALAVSAALAAMAARAQPGAPNGQIAFARFNPDLGDTQIYTVNPDGSHEHLVQSDPLECPSWSPDGSLISTCGTPTGGATRIVNPDDGSFRELPWPDAELFTGCLRWAPDSSRLACESFGVIDPNRNGIYTIRSSDGGDVSRVTANPGGDDIPGDYSPNGKRIVFARYDSAGDPLGLYVVKANGTGLKQIMPAGTLVTSAGDWSPQANEIVFSQRVAPGVRSSMWVVHADGTGLHEIAVQPASACGGAFSTPGSQGCFGPRWSPDGTKIVFSRGTSGDFDTNVYTVDVDGTGLTQVTHGSSGEAPDWGTHPNDVSR